MPHYAGAHHIQIDVYEASMQVLVGLDRRCVVAIFPEGAVTILALIVCSGRAAGDELHAPSNLVVTALAHEKMDVVGGDDVIEHAQAEALPRLAQPAQIAASVTRELEQERPVVAAVRDVPELARDMVAVRARHRGHLPQKSGFAYKNARL